MLQKQKKQKKEFVSPITPADMRSVSRIRIRVLPLIGFVLILLFALVLHLTSNRNSSRDAVVSQVTPEVVPVE